MINKLEQRIKQRVGTEYLIACYKIDETGCGYFTDLRGEEGDVVKLDAFDGQKIKIPYENKRLVEGEFYSFRWHMEESKPKHVFIDGEVLPISKPDFLSRLFDVYVKKTGKDLTDSINFQNTIFNEVTGAEHTYIYELLQNANDYPYELEKDEVSVKFIVTPNYLLFLHTGAEFNLRNIVGICSINQGEKKDNVETIGYKGIGFKTVFVNNNYVYLHSGDWKMRFDKTHSENAALGECAWSLMPIPTDDDGLDKELREAFASIPSRYRVQIALKHSRDAAENIPQLEKVFSDDQILLFIPHVSQAEVIIHGEQHYHVCKDRSRWVIDSYKFPVSPTLKDWVSKNINGGNKIPEKFKEIQNVGISFAIGRQGITLLPIENARVYNYLPTELRLGFKFLINADFVPNGSRSGLHDVKWNKDVMTECGRKFAMWWAAFLLNEGEWDMNSVFRIVPDFTSHDTYAECFFNGFSEQILQEQCIPVLVEGQYTLKRIDEIIWDEIGMTSGDDPIFLDKEFYQFTGTGYYLPHQKLRENEDLKDLLLELFGRKCETFSGRCLPDLASNEAFKKWMSIKENNIRFIGFLIKNNYISLLSEHPIFLDTEGQLATREHLYLDVDKYIGDLEFLSDFLRRIEPEVRDALRKIDGWREVEGKFKTFNEYRFANEILGRYQEIKSRLQIKENNLNFIHFLAISGVNSNDLTRLSFKFLSADNELVLNDGNLFISNDFGKSFVAQKWMPSKSIIFINEAYFEKDSVIVERYFQTLGIKSLNQKIAFDEYLSNDDMVGCIAEAIQDKQVNVAFYHYLADILDPIHHKFTRKMRDKYVLFATDGHEEHVVSISEQTYFMNEDWEESVKHPWLPNNICLVLSDCYLTSLGKDKGEEFTKYLEAANIVNRFTFRTLIDLIKRDKNIQTICENIQTKEDSKSFLEYLFVNRAYLSKDGQPDTAFQAIPILWDKHDSMFGCSDLKNKAFYHNPDLEQLCKESWFDDTDLFVCDRYYNDLFDGQDRRLFFSRLGIKTFELADYARRHILAVPKKYSERIVDKENNLAFHKFFCSLHNRLAKDDYRSLKDKFPIYITSPFNEEGQLAACSTNHYLPSDLLTRIIQEDIVPVNTLDSIHPDYILTGEERAYYSDYLGNSEIEMEQFVDLLVQNIDIVSEHLKNVNRNIKFWRWVCDASLSYKVKERLKNLPMLGFNYTNREERFYSAKTLFISGPYTEVANIEGFINEFTQNPIFISSIYKELDDNREWKSLFRPLGIKVDTRGIFFEYVLDNLVDYKRVDVVSLAAEHFDEILSMINKDDNEKILNQLSQLQLQCIDGQFKSASTTILSGKYFDIIEDPLPEVVIPNLVSEIYLEQQVAPEMKHKIKRLLETVAYHCGSECDTLTKLRDKKINLFLKTQKNYSGQDHYKVVSCFVDMYAVDPEGVRQFVSDTPFLLYNVSQEKEVASEMYLSSAYSPKCDYMAHGISELQYVDEKYLSHSDKTKTKGFFQFLGVKSDFKACNLRQLENPDFARYFWEDYAPKQSAYLKDIITEEKLKSLACIPSLSGNKFPRDLYNPKYSQLKKIVLLLQDGVHKLPSVSLPEWVDHIGLRNRLYIPDCLEYLLLDRIDFRRTIFDWITDTKEETIDRFKANINEYVECANWYNGKKQFVPLKSLVALEWGNETLKGNFSNNPYVCSPSYLPESKENYNKICRTFNIKILTNSDFEKRMTGRCIEDLVAKSEIKKRLLYLAFKSEKDDWAETYEQRARLLDATEIYSCEKIDYYYSDEIATDLMSYIDDEFKLWYVGEWNSSMFLDVLNWVICKFQIKNLEKSYLKKLFLTNFKDYLQKYENDLPAQFLDYLDETDKEGLQISQYEEIEEFEDEDDSDNYLDIIKNQNSSEHLLSGNSLGQEIDKMNTVTSHLQQDNVKKTGSEKRLDLIERNEPLPISVQDDSKKESSKKVPQNNLFDEIQNQETTTSSRSIQDKLKEKWDKHANQTVSRPVSSANDLTNRQTHVQPVSEKTYQGEFFGKDAFDSQRSQNKALKSQQNLKRLSTQASENAQQAKDQLHINELFRQATPYSYLWFKYLMELMYPEKSNPSIRSIRLDFYDKQFMSEGKMLRLLNPTTVVPQWLDNASDIQLFACGDGVSSSLNASVIKYDELSLDLLLAEDVSKELITNSNLIRVEAKNSTNIIESLKTRFHQLGYPDNYNLRDSLPRDIKFIYGPPGTGKTTRLVEILHEIIASTDNKLNILVLTPTNKAADVIAKRLAGDDLCYDYLSRYGSTEDISLIEEEAIVVNRDTMDIEQFEKNIVVTTAARYSYDTLKPNDEFICDFPWDYIIIDEASMIDIITITYILHQGKTSKFIIAGDPMQIQPIPSNGVEIENIYDMVELNELKYALANFKKYPVEALMTQYRSVPAIGNLVSKFSYNDLVLPYANRIVQKPLLLDGIDIKTINFIGFEVRDFDPLYELGAIGGSAFHLYSAIFTYNMVKYTAQQIAHKYQDEMYSIGIVCPYRVEADAIKQMIKERPIDQPNCSIHCGTVHSFQGDECDIMFVVMNPPSEVSLGTHINNKNIVNVAMSRARDYLFIVLPDSPIKGFEVKNRLGQIIDNNNREILFCRNLEKVIFGEEDYIKNHTAISCHMPVNVCCGSHFEYEIRMDDSVIDIQINEIVNN